MSQRIGVAVHGVTSVRYQVFGHPLAAGLAPRYASRVSTGQARSLTAVFLAQQASAHFFNH